VAAHAWSAIRGLLYFIGALAVLRLVFWALEPDYRNMAPIGAIGTEATLLVEGGKEFDSVVAMLTALTTGLFVLVALVARNPLRPTNRPTIGQMILLAIFAASASGSYYAGVHAKYLIADGLLAKSINLPALGQQIGLQGWLVGFSSAAAVALILDALLTVKK
jgi:hypothetical protein